MSREETYDIVIIGVGHNGTTLAAYLAKCGLSVCPLSGTCVPLFKNAECC